MLGRQHLMLSLMTASALVVPYINSFELFSMIFLAGVAIGSLIPDVDAPDATIFHSHVRGLNSEPGKAVGKFIGPVLPLFGYTTKYMIYKPAVHIFNFVTSYEFTEKHRNFSHSLLGVTSLTAVTGLYITPVLLYTGFFAFFPLAVFLLGYIFGAVLHMLEDSCTKTGIAWNAPFSSTKLKGGLKTGKDNRQPRTLLYTLGIIFLAVFFVKQSSMYSFTSLELTAVTFTALGLIWIFFMALVDVEVER